MLHDKLVTVPELGYYWLFQTSEKRTLCVLLFVTTVFYMAVHFFLPM